jgi:hypothetical protein
VKKIAKLVVQVVISEYDEAGELIDEQMTQPSAIYRAKAPDVWTYLDREILSVRLVPSKVA